MAHSETPQGRDLEETQENARELFKKYRGLGLRLTDKHAKDVDFIDVRGTLGVTDLFVLATARSDVHLKTLQEEALEYLEDHFPSVRREGETSTRWRLLDAGDVVVHLFSAQARDFYRIERIWGDAPTERFQDPDEA
ncbi:Iojap-related protein [Aminomonas paucivorans DSM 12260]|uniref:Ribosomal silencing factor RsfS n=1 Tax=Aminomonas paucivorans DSM 12260 TaxID=584708 RepID=E3D0R6_9BACT|nr:ribosome silencing factor [Aminomonas paucivorans]EFQ23887.1 Iojap-related protein [Aminomonas paucivorans DSM 12260]